jgi:hypothetical protein
LVVKAKPLPGRMTLGDGALPSDGDLAPPHVPSSSEPAVDCILVQMTTRTLSSGDIRWSDVSGVVEQVIS